MFKINWKDVNVLLNYFLMQDSWQSKHRAIPLKKDTSPVDELVICVPQDRNDAFYTM